MATWTDDGLAPAWAANTVYGTTEKALGVGLEVWEVESSVGADESGSSEPDWASPDEPNGPGTVTDNDLVWRRLPAWAAETEIGDIFNSVGNGASSIQPTTPNGHSYSTGAFNNALTGSDEPDPWPTSGGSIDDGGTEGDGGGGGDGASLLIRNERTGDSLGMDLDVAGLRMQDNGSREAAVAEFDLDDPDLVFELLPEDEITIRDIGADEDAEPLFGGYARSVKCTTRTTGRAYHVMAYDYSTLLDRTNVVQDERDPGESDHDRLVYVLTTYAPFLDPDDSGIATLNAGMPLQRFKLLSLRQTIERILASALPTATYKITSARKLVTWDTDPGLSSGPANIVVAEDPGDGAIAPDDLTIDGGSTELFNAVFVRGATAAGSGWFTDPDSIEQWGKREKYIDAPDSDLSWKAFNVGMAALADSSQPKFHGTFSTTTPNDGWRSRQRILVTSPMHSVVAGETLSAEPFDTVKVTTRYLSGDGRRQYDVAFGSPPMSFTAKHGSEIRRDDTGPGSGGGVGGGDAGIGGGGGTSEGCCQPCGGNDGEVPGSDPVAYYGHAYGPVVFAEGDGSTVTFDLPVPLSEGATTFLIDVGPTGEFTTIIPASMSGTTVTFTAPPATDALLAVQTSLIPCPDLPVDCAGAEQPDGSAYQLIFLGANAPGGPFPPGYDLEGGFGTGSMEGSRGQGQVGSPEVMYTESRTVGAWELPEGCTHVRIRGRLLANPNTADTDVEVPGEDEYAAAWRLATTEWDPGDGAEAGWEPNGDTISAGSASVPSGPDDWNILENLPVLATLDTIIPVTPSSTFMLHLSYLGTQIPVLQSEGMPDPGEVVIISTVDPVAGDENPYLDAHASVILVPLGDGSQIVTALIGCE